MKETRTIKIWANTYRRLKIMAAVNGETLVELLERLTTQEERKTVSESGKK